MTISLSESDPLIVVVGATGTQGGSVINNLEASDVAYRIRGLTRDSSKETAKALERRGVQIHAVSISVGNEVEVEKAFGGANYIFAVTNFWEHLQKSREVAEGKLMVDAALAAKVDLFVLSSEPGATEVSKGKYTHVDPFDSKWEVSQYARKVGLPVVDVHVGGYMNNFTTVIRPRPSSAKDGTYLVVGTWPPNAKQPLIDTFHDCGLFVRLALESKEFNRGTGNIISAYGEWLSIDEQCKILSEVSGKKVVYTRLSDDEYQKILESSGIPPELIPCMLELGHFHSEFWVPTYVHSNREGLARQPRTFKQYCEAQNWNDILT